VGGRESGIMSTNARPRASLGVQKRNIIAVLARAHAMYTAFLAAIAMLPSPTVAMTVFIALIQSLDVSQQSVTSSKAKGLAAARNQKRNELWTAMETLRAYVQSIADTLTADAAAALIESAALVVAKIPGKHKDILSPVLVPGQPGTVRLFANLTILMGKARGKKHQINWTVSSDGGKSWSILPSTPFATTDVPDLAMLVEHQFKVSVTIGKSTGDWSQPAKLLVH
jgi:hypothetical protein